MRSDGTGVICTGRGSGDVADGMFGWAVSADPDVQGNIERDR